jgi:hypothetical protein
MFHAAALVDERQFSVVALKPTGLRASRIDRQYNAATCQTPKCALFPQDYCDSTSFDAQAPSPPKLARLSLSKSAPCEPAPRRRALYRNAVT